MRAMTRFSRLAPAARFGRGRPVHAFSTDSVPNIALVLSGCGVYDGTEITEAVSVLIHLGGKANVQCFAPDKDQYHVIDHTTGKEMQEKRNVMLEAARIARGNIKPLQDLKAADYDCAIFPGGFGVAKNLSTFGYEGEQYAVDDDVTRVIEEFHAAKKIQGFCCIAPLLPAKVLRAVVTMGNDGSEENAPEGKWPCAEACGAVEKAGGIHVNTAMSEAYYDGKNRIVSCAAYMCGTASPNEVYKSVGAMVRRVLSNVANEAHKSSRTYEISRRC